MKSRNTLILGSALLVGFALLWLWKPRAESAARPRLERVEAPEPNAAAAAQQPTQELRDGAPKPASIEALLPPEQHDATLRTVVGPVLGCITSAGLSTPKMDPRMHARVHVGKGVGHARIERVELIGGEDAPPRFRKCIEESLLSVALTLPPDTEGVVITPPLAGHNPDLSAQGP